ncbi:hypothetical protein GGR50DRAFT_696186 [Xylaria sp. CBS 124048]|nr:hypothetical protein GGR50DRAFT_696186 [Xylaria sp. CBS 124048]
MTALSPADGETEPSGPLPSQPDVVTQSDPVAEPDPAAPHPNVDAQPETANQNDAPNVAATSASGTSVSNPSGNGTSKNGKGSTRRRAATMKPPPTLLTDFLLGRPSPARIAADKKAAKEIARRRRMSLEAVKHEMRQAAVQRIQAPGGVRDRVTKWQKANAAAMARADPLAAPSEPTEVNLQVDQESVTEEDRVRIKMRQKKRPPLNITPVQMSPGADEPKKEDQKRAMSASPPKKRVVSDTNWVKNHGPKNSSTNASPKAKPPEGTGSPLPKDFLSRPTPNLPISKKIKEWASRVEMPEPLPRPPHYPKSVGTESVVSGDGIRIKPVTCDTASESEATSSRSKGARGTKTPKLQKRKELDDDGIRVRPLTIVKAQETEKKDEPRSSTLPDDGIRVRPMRPESRDSSTVRSPSITRPHRRGSRNHKNAPRRRASSVRKEAKNPQLDENKPPINSSTPKRVNSKPPGNHRRRPKSMGDAGIMMNKETSDIDSWTSESESESDVPSAKPQKPLADISFGQSAFSELELPRALASRPAPAPAPAPAAKPKAKQQSTSFQHATNALKKALNEGKKILAEKVDPPRPPMNQPPNIESWLKDTVDPFFNTQDEVSDEPKRTAANEEWVPERKVRDSAPSPSSRHQSAEPDERESGHKSNEQKTTSKRTYDESSDDSDRTPSPGELKRTQTRVSSHTGKSASRRNFKEKIRDAFRGESALHGPSRAEYLSFEEVVDDENEHAIDHHRRHRSIGGSSSQAPSDEDSLIPTEPALVKSSSKRRAPPATDSHDLSAKASDTDMLSTLQLEASSDVSEATLPRATMKRNTGLTRSTATRRRSQKSELKRRLTRHSDLVSVLSLPNDSAMQSRNRSLRSARSVRRSSNHPQDATVESLLREFARDEDLYSRELKTLVAGVIPVLLSQSVNGGQGPSGDLFGSPNGPHKGDPLPKAVVNMGVVLEKLKSQHRKCPLGDVHQLPLWLETIAPIYGHYLDVWRLGFQGIVVNLAPASPDDEDSLLNAMPRNEEGDLLNEHGDRIDVAHLLKRPLVRTKWITRFIQGYRAVTGTTEYESLAARWEVLQAKARKRHKEETARIVDDDAKNTDISRTRDLKNMAAAENVKIDRFRQVYAKDWFSLDLRHSNGQRLNCQVELIYRDNQLFKSDPGDLLIREIGSGGRSWLLFAPATGNYVSARRGDDKHQMVVMIRGYDDEWSEVMTLTAEDEEQVLDWLHMLGSSPVPPKLHNLGSSVLAPSSTTISEPPLGERKRWPQNSSTSTPPNNGEEEPQTTTYHRRHPDSPTRPPPAIPTLEKTPSRDSSTKSRRRLSASPSQNGHRQGANSQQENMHPDLSVIDEASTDDDSCREDGAPTPPKHRTLDAKPQFLAPPTDAYSRVKRQSSSPLKHEYHPSDMSSESAPSSSESENDYSYSDDESSNDELEAVEMPDAIPAISIRQADEPNAESVISEGAISRTPSPLGSQMEVPINTTSTEPNYTFKSLATISYWDDKHGCWKDLWPDTCSIVTTPGLIEAYPFRRAPTSPGDSDREDENPLIALDLTPLVMLRTSTALDIEIRSPVLRYARLYNKVTKMESTHFRFRAASLQECEALYTSAHRARMDNKKYKALEEETRVRAFGQGQVEPYDGEETSQRRSWFGRKNSYRASARAPSQSAGSTSHNSSVSASSFLKKLMGGGGQFNIARSSIHRQRFGSGENSLYTSSSGGSPRSPSVSAANSGAPPRKSLTTNNLKIRLHLLVSNSKWEDYGNCYLEVARPDQGTRQNLRKYQGMEKRIIVTTLPKKASDVPRVALDVVLGSRCFSRLGSRGILLNVWEEVRDERGKKGVAPKGGGSGGNVNKWCFQCTSVVEASWIYGLVTQEVVIS